MVRANPSAGPGPSGAVLHDDDHQSDASLQKGGKQAPEQAQQSPAARQVLPILNVSVAVVVLAVMLVGFRPSWLPSLQPIPAVTSPFHGVFKWISDNGANMGAIEVASFDEYYELVAAGRIEQGETLLSVPMSLILDENMILEDEIVQAVLESTSTLDENGAAVVFLLANQEKWGVYLEMIQSLNVPSPLFWSKDDTALLTGSMINRLMDELTALLEEQYSAVQPFFEGLALDYYTRLWVNVNSRMWQLQKSETESVGALMPVFDFATHSPAPNVEVGYSAELDSVVMTSIAGINPSDAIHNFYYNTSNIHHLLFQGFTVEDNDENLACEVSVVEERCSIESSVGNPITDALVNCVQVNAVATTLDAVKTTWSNVAELASNALNAFPETIEDDERLLQKSTTANQYNAVQARRSEKICLSLVKSFSEMLSAAVESDSLDKIDVAVASTRTTREYLESIKALNNKLGLAEDNTTAA